MNINTTFKLSLLTVLLFFTACSPQYHKPTITKTDEYKLTQNYANHRAQQSSFVSSGGKIAYLDYGSGPVLVLLHGVPTSSWLFRKMLPDLQRHFRVIAIDLLGYGSSDKPKSSTQNYTASFQANYVQELLLSLGINQYSLLFHDMGGLVAWELVNRDLAQQQSNRAIKDLVVLNTIISEQGFEHPNIKRGLMARQMAQAFSNKLSSAAILEMTFSNMGLGTESKLSEGECFGYVEPMREGADEALYDFFTGFDQSLFDDLDRKINGLSKFTGQTLVLWGANDKVLTTAQLPRLQGALNIPEENMTIFPKNAHLLPEEIPQTLVNKIISGLL